MTRTTGRICLTFDNMGNAKAVHDGAATGPDESEPGLARGYPRLLDLLEELGVRGTFFIEGWNAVHHPHRVLELAQRGHEVGLHGWMHEPLGELPEAEVDAVIRRGTQALRDIGLHPVGFRAPGAERGPYAEPVLAELGYRYDSSQGEKGETCRGSGPWSVRNTVLKSGLVHVGWLPELVDSIQYLRRRPALTPQQLRSTWLEAVDAIGDTCTTTTFVMHAYLSGADDERFSVICDVLQHARRRGDIEICTASSLVESVLQQDR